MAHADAGGEIDPGRIFVRLVGDDDDRRDPFGGELAGQHRHGQAAVERLAAGHRHGVVEQQLVGDVDLGGDRGADRQHPRMGIGAVAEIGEDMRGFGKRRLADPRRPLAAHLGEGRGRAVHELRQIVAADAGNRAAALGHFGRSVVRAARAEIGGAGERHDIAAELTLLRFEKGEPLDDARRGMKAGDALGDHPGDLGRGQFAVRRQDPVAVLVELADDARAHILAPIVELLLELVFDDRALFFDDQDFFEALGEMADALAFERPRHRHLVKADADLGGMGLVDAQIVERLAHVEIGFAGGDDAKARVRAVDDDAVEPIGAGKGERGVELVFVQPVFLVERLVGPADIEPARRHLEIVGQHDPGSRRSDIDRGRAVDRLGDRLEGDPAAGIARHRPAIQAEIEDFLHPRRVQHRDAGVHEGVFGLMRQGRGFAGVVVAGEQQHPAMRRRAGGIAVLQRVAAAVDARPLGVPHGKDAVVFGAGEQAELLAAPYRGGARALR